MPVTIGQTTDFPDNNARSIVLLAPATATNGAPSLATDGLDTSVLFNAFGEWPQTVGLQIYSTAGSGTMTASCRLWGFVPNATGTPKWIPIGETFSLVESSADSLAYVRPLDTPGHFQRLYCEVTAIGGTSTSITAELVVRRGSPR